MSPSKIPMNSYDFIGGGSANASFRDGLLRVDGQWFLVAMGHGDTPIMVMDIHGDVFPYNGKL